MVRVAAVDLGTNSTRLLIGDVEGDRVEEIVRLSTVTRLGEGVDAGRRLLPAAIARVHAVLADYRRELEALDAERSLAVATSAVRDAANGAEFLAGVERAFRLPTRLLSGDEEAELTRRGVGAVGDTALVVDVGGGSTELIAAGFRTSLDIGSTRLSERFLHSDPPRPEELAAAAEYVQGLLPPLEATSAVGVAGTVAQLRALAGPLTLAAVEAELVRLATVPLAERRLVAGLDPARAPVIVGGAVIVAEVLRRYRLAELVYSVRDLLDGAALEAASGS
ncbi:MAG TPA: exopolyphosphatase [Gaiellaceae bacterium]|jgi:exopolyphosphatase/guanosine-5'-triphosphate,3'-diphosphate pyrophosphatase